MNYKKQANSNIFIQDRPLFRGLPIDKGINVFVTIDGFDKDGKQIHTQTEKANSFVGNFFGLLLFNLNNTTIPSGITVKDTTNNTRIFSIGFNITAGSANANSGIVVGTSNQAVAIGDYNLIARIAHGTGAGQLSHGAFTANAVTGTTTYTWTFTRSFTNSSGGNIVIAESGLIGANTYFVLIERSVLGSTYTVNNGASCIVTYTMTFTIV